MKMYFWRGEHPNFGDELNVWMWPKLLPGFFDDDESTVFLRIGSILNKYLPYQSDSAVSKIVFGCGLVSKYGGAPNVGSPEWKIYFVRGPRTARELNISSEYAVGDAAILARILFSDSVHSQNIVSFMPHHGSLDIGNWSRVCVLAGIHMINPRSPVEEVFADILRSKLVICEAMHGAILSDALRVPWVPVLPLRRAHRAKWYDWAEALDIELLPQKLFPSTVSELMASNIPNRIWPIDRRMVWPGLDDAVMQVAARRLVQLSQCTPTLSSDISKDRATDIMVGKIAKIKLDYRRPT
jgi:succinoglycan biosynthesis protein ExoV